MEDLSNFQSWSWHLWELQPRSLNQTAISSLEKHCSHAPHNHKRAQKAGCLPALSNAASHQVPFATRTSHRRAFHPLSPLEVARWGRLPLGRRAGQAPHGGPFQEVPRGTSNCNGGGNVALASRPNSQIPVTAGRTIMGFHRPTNPQSPITAVLKKSESKTLPRRMGKRPPCFAGRRQACFV